MGLFNNSTKLIVFITNKKYLIGTIVTLYSLLKHNLINLKENFAFRIYY